MGCPFLLQGIFLAQGSNLHLLHWQEDSLPLSHQGSPGLCYGQTNAIDSKDPGKLLSRGMAAIFTLTSRFLVVGVFWFFFSVLTHEVRDNYNLRVGFLGIS